MTTTIDTLLADCAAAGIALTADDGQLRVQARKGALTPDLTERLRAAKPALLAHLQAQQAPQPLGADAPRPLSAAQERLWILQRYHPESSMYHLASVIVLCGIDGGTVDAALRRIVDRHQVLRSTVGQDGHGVPFARVLPTPARLLAEGAPIAASDRAGIDDCARAHCARPFDLARDLPLRASWHPIAGTGDHALILVIHHIAFDGWSGGVFYRELRAACQALANGDDPALPALPVQVADVSAWQQAREERGVLQGLLDQAAVRLRALPMPDLPTDFPRPAEKSYRGGFVDDHLDAATAGRIRELAAACGVSAFTVHLATLALLVHRSTGATDFGIATPASDRPPGSEDLIGCFLNTLVVRAGVDDQGTVGDLLRACQQANHAALGEQELPFQRLIEHLQPRRDPARPALAPVLLNYDSMPHRAEDECWPAVREQWRVDAEGALFDLSCYVAEIGDGVRLRWEYASELFTPATVSRYSARYRTILAALCAGADRPVAAVPWLPEDERRFLIEDVNRTATDDDLDVRLETLIDRTAAACGDAVAVRDRDGVSSYRELVAASHRMAAHLHAHGVRPGDRVGVCLDRSRHLPAVLLGVLRCGAAYLPLDPAFPAARLALMVEDAQPRLIVCDTLGDAALPSERPPCLRLDDADERQVPPPPALAGSDAGTDTLAYLLYTSGSTGRPKGVAITQRNLGNFLQSMRRRPGFAAGEHLLAVTTLSFDISGLELFLPLISGGSVQIESNAAVRDGAALLADLRAAAPCVVQATPATWRMLLDAGWDDHLAVRALCGGEALPADLAGRLLPLVDELWNLYGPTETTIWSTVARITDTAVDVGTPIGNTTVLVVDAGGAPAGIGIPGELLIGGAGVADGYWRREALTAERFVADPLGGSGRMYRTGDLARIRADGRIDVLGRLDHQVKVRGYRIELGEIEAALLALPEVAQAVVMAPPDAHGTATLCAWLVAAGSAEPGLADLRPALVATLPGYMLPNRIRYLPALPLTPNGKVDRAALPPIAPDADTDATGEPPRGEREELVASVFAEVLERPVTQIARQDGFFDLGGHSLLSLRAVERLERASGVRVPPGALVQQSVAQIAASLTPTAAGAETTA